MIDFPCINAIIRIRISVIWLKESQVWILRIWFDLGKWCWPWWKAIWIFISVFTVCQSIRYRVTNKQRVKDAWCEYRKTCVKRPLLNRPKMVFNTVYRLMQVKNIAECSKGKHSAILSSFIKLPVVIKIFVLSFFEWPFYTGFSIHQLS